MTWKRLQILVESLLTNDLRLAPDEQKRLALLEYALNEVAQRAKTFRLTGITPDSINIRYNSIDDTYTRLPTLPTSDEDLIDIDQQLIFAVARYMASYITQDKNMIMIHKNEASDIIIRYNSTVESYIEHLIEQQGYDYVRPIYRKY